MPMPSFRPDTVINALNRGFDGRSVWPTANSDPERHYQMMAVAFHYVYETQSGYVLTDLGHREIVAEWGAKV